MLESILKKLLFCDFGVAGEPNIEFVGAEFHGEDRSSLNPNFDAETPGDILGVNYYDPLLTREELRAVAKKVFVNAHPDRFCSNSTFAITYRIKTYEQANAAFKKYKLAYDEFCKAKDWPK